jgi:hypothetical protein
MRAQRLLAFSFLCTTLGACAAAQVRRSGTLRQNDLTILLDHATFDGHELRGRLLIATTTGRRTIDPLSWPSQGLVVTSERRCSSPEELSIYVRDGGWLTTDNGKPPIVTLLPGFWFGTDLDILVSSSDEGSLDCVLMEATLPLEVTGQPGSEIRFSIRAERGGQVALIEPK